MQFAVPLRAHDPTRLGGYELRGRLGEGGQGVVYLGVGAAGEYVAIKWLRPGMAADPVMVQRFVREVSAAERVAPFCTAQVLGTGVEHDRPFIVSEYVDGPSLQKVVKESGPRSGAALYRLAIGTATALAAIHQAGIVHRDFKPANVLLAPDGPRVIDFGVARAMDVSMTLSSGPMGTPSFMAPEQIHGAATSPATDMFAWAGTMIYAATGTPPFGEDSLPSVINRVLNTQPDLTGLAGLDGRLLELVRACLDKDPARRPSAEQVILRLLAHPSSAPLHLGEAAAAASEEQRPSSPQVPGAIPPQASGPVPPSASGPIPPQVPGSAPAQAYGSVPSSASGPVPPQAPGSVPAQAYGSVPPQVPGSLPASAPGPVPPQTVPDAQATRSVAGDSIGTLDGPGLQQTIPPSGRRRRGLLAGVAAGVAVVLVGAVVLYLQGDQRSGGEPANLAVGSSASSAEAAPTSSAADSPTTTPTPSPSGVPTDGVTARTLSGLTGFRLYEHPADPIWLVAYGVEDAKGGKWTRYARDIDGGFSKYGGTISAATSPNGRYVARVDDDFTDGYDAVEITDLQAGTKTVVKTVKGPLETHFEQWSRDSRRILLDLRRKVNGKWGSGGFVIVTVGEPEAKVVRPADVSGAVEYVWSASGDEVVAEVKSGDKIGVRFYSVDGAKVREFSDTGDPGVDEMFSPSGREFATKCPGAAEDKVCVYDTQTGKEIRRIPYDCAPLLGWYDDKHLYCWYDGEDAAGNDVIEVFDFAGKASRKLISVKDGERLSPTFSVKPPGVTS